MRYDTENVLLSANKGDGKWTPILFNLRKGFLVSDDIDADALIPLRSFMRCIKSPISLVSKKDMGSFNSFMKKSLISDILILILICSKSQRRMKFFNFSFRNHLQPFASYCPTRIHDVYP